MSEPAVNNTPPARVPKARSCVVCRSRKVRCDKQSPCANCRRANIACIFPSADRPPRWARRLHQLNNHGNDSMFLSPAGVPNAEPNGGNVMNRLQNLESLVKELRSQLADAHTASSTSAGSGAGSSPESMNHSQDTEYQSETQAINKQFGRMVIQDPSRSRYVSSGFWSRIDDELAGLKADTLDLSEDESENSDEAPLNEVESTQNLSGAGSHPSAFLFHSSTSSTFNLQTYHPLPSQIPFLLDKFSENVNIFFRTVHMPSTAKMAQTIETKERSSSNEALLFSIYYAAIASMEEEDVMTNFGYSKFDLTRKYRFGLEQALANANFLINPDLTLVQAFINFLLLARRDENPRFVWMMTGLLIRMTQYLGLQRDGEHFKNLSPYDIEMRRRVFWTTCLLDMRASEDQGTDVSIVDGTFDTELPLNINDADISPDLKSAPTEHFGVTEMSWARISAATTQIMRKMTQISTRGVEEGVSALEYQDRLRNEYYQKYHDEYFQFRVGSDDILCWMARCVCRLVMAKMELIVYLPVLSSPTEHISDEIRTKLLSSAIEVAEYNHMLNAEKRCIPWRWLFQTHTHWHSIVYLLIEISRRPWSPIIERAWVALHSNWLIPTRLHMDKSLRIWFPLRKLMDKARKHRDAELQRLRGDLQAIAQLEVEDQAISLPSSSGPFSEKFRERWRQLVGSAPGDDGKTDQEMPAESNVHHRGEPKQQSRPSGYQHIERNESKSIDPPLLAGARIDPNVEQTVDPAFDTLPEFSMNWSDDYNIGPGFEPWLWPEVNQPTDLYMGVDHFDENMDFIGETNWLDFVESATSMERQMGNRPGNV